MDRHPRMHLISALVLVFAGLAPAAALASGNGDGDGVMVVAGVRVITNRGASVAEGGAVEPDVAVLREGECRAVEPDAVVLREGECGAVEPDVVVLREAEYGAVEPDVVVLRGAEVGGAIPDPASVRRERRPFLPPMQLGKDAREAPMRVQIVLPAGPTYTAWLPSKRARSDRFRAHNRHPKHYKHRKHDKKRRGSRVAAAPPRWVSPTFGAPHSSRRLVSHRGGHSAKHRPGHGAGRKH